MSHSERPPTIPFARPASRPTEPRLTFVSHIPVNGGCATAITRVWDESRFRTCGDLCGAGPCTFEDGVCVVGEGRYVAPELCAFFAKGAAG